MSAIGRALAVEQAATRKPALPHLSIMRRGPALGMWRCLCRRARPREAGGGFVQVGAAGFGWTPQEAYEDWRIAERARATGTPW